METAIELEDGLDDIGSRRIDPPPFASAHTEGGAIYVNWGTSTTHQCTLDEYELWSRSDAATEWTLQAHVRDGLDYWCVELLRAETYRFRVRALAVENGVMPSSWTYTGDVSFDVGDQNGNGNGENSPGAALRPPPVPGQELIYVSRGAMMPNVGHLAFGARGKVISTVFDTMDQFGKSIVKFEVPHMLHAVPIGETFLMRDDGCFRPQHEVYCPQGHDMQFLPRWPSREEWARAHDGANKLDQFCSGCRAPIEVGRPGLFCEDPSHCHPLVFCENCTIAHEETNQWPEPATASAAGQTDDAFSTRRRAPTTTPNHTAGSDAARALCGNTPEHLQNTSYHKPVGHRGSWMDYWKAMSQFNTPTYCPCTHPDQPRVQHELGRCGNAVGAHVLFYDFRRHYYCGIVPVCSGCNTGGRRIAYQCHAVTIADAGAQTYFGKVAHPNGGRSFASIDQVVRASSQQIVRLIGTDDTGEPLRAAYPDKDQFIQFIANLANGGLAADGRRQHVSDVVCLNKGVCGSR